MVPLLIKNRTEEDLRLLRIASDELEAAARKAEPPETLAALDIGFHLLLGAATHNPSVERLYSFVMELYRPAIAGAYDDKTPALLGAELHRSLLVALQCQDRTAAGKAIDAAVDAWGAGK